MQRLKIPEPVDACVCALDSINDATKPQGMSKKRSGASMRAFARAGFLCSISTRPTSWKTLTDRCSLDETEDSDCVRRGGLMRSGTASARYGMDLFQQANDGLWERSFEEHVERAYTPEELSQWLTDAALRRSSGSQISGRKRRKRTSCASFLRRRKDRTMQDQITRAMTKDGLVNAVAITSAGIVERARQIHKLLPTATAALGRLLSAASMMGNMQKTEDGSDHPADKGRWPLGQRFWPSPTQRATCAAMSITRRSAFLKSTEESSMWAQPLAMTACSPSSGTFG